MDGNGRRRAVDLCAGLGGGTSGFASRDWDVVTNDIDPRFGCTVTRDILEVEDLAELEGGQGPFDFIWASPPCESFSVMTIGKNWEPDVLQHRPKTPKAAMMLRIAEHCFDLIARYKERHPGVKYLVENPRGMMRKVVGPPTATTWYCRWGMPYAKPTDVWTNLLGPWPVCRPLGKDHAYAPRGSDTGVQGDIGAKERRERLLRGEEVPGWKLVTSKDGDHRKGLQIVVRTGGKKAQRIDAASGRNWNPRFPNSAHIDVSRASRGRGGLDVQFLEKIRQAGGLAPGCGPEPSHDYQPAGYKAKKAAGVLGLGTQGDASMQWQTSALRAIVPYRLSLACAIAAETDGRLPSPESLLPKEDAS